MGRVLLISLLRNSHRNLGCLTLFSSLNQKGIDTHLLFLPAEEHYREDEVSSFVEKNAYSLIGISVMTEDFNFACTLTANLKKSFPGIHVVWGGIHPTLMPEECLDHADSVCLGEGEWILPILAERIAAGAGLEDLPEDLPGIAMRSSGVTALSRTPAAPMDLDQIPFNRYDWSRFHVQDSMGLRPFTEAEYVRYSHYDGEDYTLMATRGCPFSCSYCCNSYLNTLYDHQRLRKRSVDHVLAEIRHARLLFGASRRYRWARWITRTYYHLSKGTRRRLRTAQGMKRI